MRSESETEINRIAKILTDNPTLRVEISGHTDNIGKDDYNQWLSEKRAESVVKALIKLGIPASMLEFKGYGELDPISTNLTDEGRQENRRTEFKIISK